ncbi:hypothetical protein JCM16303_001649 [Sporobolomyces ruberrimus]
MSDRGYVDAAPGRRTAAGALLIGGYHPSKLWVGGLPDSATLADLEDCFGQIGPCSCNIKRGFGFVEYNDPAHAKEAVAKYNEGHFLGAQIKVELSLARAPEGSSKAGSEPSTPFPNHSAPPPPVPLVGLPVGGANSSGCFVCGSPDHWARECPDADKMPQRNPPGSDRPSDARKPMWINGAKGGARGGRNGPPPVDRPLPPRGPPVPPGPPGGYGPPPPDYPPRYDMPPFDRPPYGVPPVPPRYGAPPPPVYGRGPPDPYYDRPPPPGRDGYPPYGPPPGAGYPAPLPFDRPPYPAYNGSHAPPPGGPPRDDPYADRYGPPPPGRSPIMPPAPYGRHAPIDARPPYGAPLDPYARGGPPPLPLDGPPSGPYDPREERGGPPPSRFAPYPSREERGRPNSAYGDRSPRQVSSTNGYRASRQLTRLVSAEWNAVDLSHLVEETVTVLLHRATAITTRVGDLLLLGQAMVDLLLLHDTRAAIPTRDDERKPAAR